MTRVPPVGIEHVDVSSLLQEVSALRAEVRSLTAVRAEVADIANSLKAMQTVVLRPVVTAGRQYDDDHPRKVASLLVDASTADTELKIPKDKHDVETNMQPDGILMYSEMSATTVVQQTAVSPAAAGNSYATFARNLQGTGMIEKRQSRKSPSPVVGQSSSNLRLKSVLTKRSIDIFISRLLPETDVDEVISCARDVLGNDDLIDITCVKLKSKHIDLYSSFHVSIKVDAAIMKRHINLLMAADSWPSGTLVRRYFKPKNGE